MATKKNSEEKRPVKNVLVKGKVKYIELADKEIEELQNLAAEAAKQEV